MRGGLRRMVALAFGAMLLALWVLFTSISVRSVRAQTPLLPNGDFESGTSGWAPPSSGTWVVDNTIPSPAGGNAAHVTGAGDTVVITSQYWNAPIQPGATYRAEAWLRDDSDDVFVVSLGLEFVDGNGMRVDSVLPSALAGSGPDYHLVSTETGPAPTGALYAVFRISADAASGGTFSIDGARIIETAAATPTPVPTTTSTPSPATPLATTQPTPTATPSPTGTAVATPTPLPVILPLLWNADFEDGTGAWSAVGGDLTTESVLDGFGSSLVLRAGGSSTAWVQQLVSVEPGGWYDAGAVLAPLEGVAAARVRIAWYATATGGGSQIGTADSGAVSGAGRFAFAQLHETVATGPVQAPATAFTARVRILLQPSTASGARLAIDHVTFRPSSAPKPTATPTATATPTPSATPTPTPPATSTPVVLAPAAGTPEGGGGGSTTSPTATTMPETRIEATALQWWLRITEVMPDPAHPGRDAEYEWVEITNLGSEDTTLEGLRLRDNAGFTVLPTLGVPAGASVVIAGALAEVEADIRLDGGIGNGLGNTGDRLELVDAAGGVIDAVAYGSGLPLAAPGTGESLQRWFDTSAIVVAAESGTPSPGGYVPRPVAATGMDTPTTPASTAATQASSDAVPNGSTAAGGSDLTWALLLGIAGGAAGGAAIQRFGAGASSRPLRNRFPPGARITPVENDTYPTEREGSHGLG